MLFKRDYKRPILITCGKGLAPYLEAELEELGFAVCETRENGITIEGAMHDCMRLNLCLRTATNVFFELGAFACSAADALYEHLMGLAWEKIIPADGYVSVVSRVDTQSITNTMFANLKVKDAVVDRIQKHTGRRPNSGPRRDRAVVQLYWKDRDVRIYINTSGQKISDRSYRKIPYKAPMRESLAAGVILETGYDGRVPLVNPMCGSGTLAIEAALIAQGRPPGLLRGNFGFMHLAGYDDQVWKTLRQQVSAEAKKEGPKEIAPIIATDIAPDAVEAARKNAMTAGVEHLIEFAVCDFAQTRLPEGSGIVILNPEYGLRLGEEKGLGEVYGRIGDFFKQRCAGYTGYIFTGNMNLAKKVGLRTSRRTVFFNGDIECRLLKYELYAGTRKEKPEHEGDD